MNFYYLDDRAPPNGDHEVHTDSCARLPPPSHTTYLGFFNDCHKAVAKAREKYPRSKGCYACARPCHTG